MDCVSLRVMIRSCLKGSTFGRAPKQMHNLSKGTSSPDCRLTTLCCVSKDVTTACNTRKLGNLRAARSFSVTASSAAGQHYALATACCSCLTWARYGQLASHNHITSYAYER
eukprot:GHUV01033697.1.p1 GENE.GHUV01033697.1~~GHUV01033697.1.p1  ORF type:complete len:112 (-),score=7.93 GHUV01033697.1:531-866(-)